MNNMQRNSPTDDNNSTITNLTNHEDDGDENILANGVIENDANNQDLNNPETANGLANGRANLIEHVNNSPIDDFNNNEEEPRTPPPTGPPALPPTPLITTIPSDPDIRIPNQLLPPNRHEPQENIGHHVVLTTIFSPVSRFMPLVFLLIFHLPRYVIVASTYVFHNLGRLFVALLFILKVFILMGLN